MRNEEFGVDHTLIQLVMVLKMQQLTRQGIPTLRYENLEDYLALGLWKKGCPKSLHEATNQVLSVNPQDIVRFLAKDAIVRGSSCDLSDFTDLIGGR